MAKGFRAYVQVYDEVYYVNTFTGEGYDLVIKKLDPLLRKLASKIYIPGYNHEDLKNELVVMALEGIQVFEPERNVKLSTFLQTHLHNKIISWIRGENRLSNDAFGLLDDVNAGSNKLRKNREEISFSAFETSLDGEDGGGYFENTVAEENGMFSDGIPTLDEVEFRSTLLKASEQLDHKTRKIVELISLKDYSIKDAGEKVGLTGWAASVRLKRLSERGSFRAVFKPEKEEVDASKLKELPNN